VAALNTEPRAIATAFCRSLQAAERREQPFEHWLPIDAVDPDVVRELVGLPIPAPDIAPTQGKRETNNASRTYVNARNRARFPLWDALAGAFQAPETVRALETICQARLRDTFLRIEYCQDVDGFWLEPHTDISVKRITILIYLSGDPDDGTDLLDWDQKPAGRAPFAPGRGFVFVPGSNTWHGFLPRPIRGVRRSLIVNYVTAEWRARREPAFADLPVA